MLLQSIFSLKLLSVDLVRLPMHLYVYQHINPSPCKGSSPQSSPSRKREHSPVESDTNGPLKRVKFEEDRTEVLPCKSSSPLSSPCKKRERSPSGSDTKGPLKRVKFEEDHTQVSLACWSMFEEKFLVYLPLHISYFLNNLLARDYLSYA